MFSPFIMDPSYPKVVEVIAEHKTNSTDIRIEDLGTLSCVWNGRMAPENVRMLGETTRRRSGTHENIRSLSFYLHSRNCNRQR